MVTQRTSTAGWNRLAAIAFGVGLIVRLLLMPTGGTLDVQSWKAWAYTCAVDGPDQIYGSNENLPFTISGISRALSGDVANRKVLWNGKRYYVDYPPLTMYYLTVVGKLYLALDPHFSDSPLLDFLVRLPTFIADSLLALLLYWYVARKRQQSITPPIADAGQASSRDVIYPALAEIDTKIHLPSAFYLLPSTLSYWLNPGLMLALGLGYLDASFTLPLAASVILLQERRYLPAWLLFVLAVLTKLQGVFLLPVLLLVTVAERGWRTLGYIVAAGGMAGLLILPYILNGRFTQLLAGLSYNGQENFVSGNNANLWWLVSYAHEAASSGPGVRTDLYKVTDFSAQFGISPRPIGLALYGMFVMGTLVWLWFRLRNGERGRQDESRLYIAAGAAMLFYGYTMLLTQVHENHLYPFFALWFLFVALGSITNHAPTGGDAHKTETYATTDAKTEPSARNGTHITRPATRVYILASAVYFLNLFLFYGLGQGTPLGDDGGGLRMALGFDLTVPLALGNLLLFGWTVRLLFMRDGVANQGR